MSSNLESETVHKHEFLRFRTMTQDDFGGPVSKEGLSVPIPGTRSGESIGVLTSGGDSQGYDDVDNFNFIK